MAERNFTTPEPPPIFQTQNDMARCLTLLRGITWAVHAAVDADDLDNLAALLCETMPILGRRLDDVSVAIGNGRFGNWDEENAA